MKKENLTFLEQAELLQKRGIKIDDLERAAKKLETISYYKLKEFAEPFRIKDLKNEIKYADITFEDMIERYYQDKNLRIYLMHTIEKIEVSFKTRIAYNLGNLGSHAYLDTNKWIDRGNHPKKTNENENKINKSNNKILENNKSEFWKILERYLPKYYNINSDDGILYKEPDSVWIFINKLTFGEAIKIYELMSYNRKKSVANYYQLNVKELNSWIKAIKLIRNLCAHNDTIIDFKFKTKPILKSNWKDYLTDLDNQDSSHLALVILIIKYFVDIINPKYNYTNIKKELKRITSNSNKKAVRIGFKNKSSIKKLHL